MTTPNVAPQALRARALLMLTECCITYHGLSRIDPHERGLAPHMLEMVVRDIPMLVSAARGHYERGEIDELCRWLAQFINEQIAGRSMRRYFAWQLAALYAGWLVNEQRATDPQAIAIVSRLRRLADDLADSNDEHAA